LLTNKIEQLKYELEFYKNHAQRHDPSIAFGDSISASEHEIHPGLSSEHHHDLSHYYPRPIKADLEQVMIAGVSFHARSHIQANESVSLRVSECLPQPDQDTTHDHSDYKQSTLLQSKLEKLEANLNTLAASTIESRPKKSTDSKMVALRRLNKEQVMVMNSLDDVKSKLEANQSDIEKVHRKLTHADSVKAEEKIIVDLEAKLGSLECQKAVLKTEYEISSKIEKDLKNKIAVLIEEIEKQGNYQEASAMLKSTLYQSKIVLDSVDPAPVSDLREAKEPEDVKDHNMLAVPRESETIELPVTDPSD
jgi:hypothetical protein